MNLVILGNGDEELGWARWLLEQNEHRLDAAFPGFELPELRAVPAPRDLEDALARPGLDAVIVGGPPGFRAEALRRAAAEGLAIIALHPPGPDSEAYYQVALSREETGATIVPDLPARLHPGVSAMREALARGELGAFRVLRWEGTSGAHDLVRSAFARHVDVFRAVLGDIESLTATGDPPGEEPQNELTVHLRAVEARRGEARIEAGPPGPSRLVLIASEGSIALELGPTLDGPARLARDGPPGGPSVVELPPWDAHAAIVSVLGETLKARGGPAGPAPAPSLLDGTRAMEVAEAVARGLRRGRTIELHYEAISEEATFKSVMTSTGCLILLSILFVLPLSMAGPPLGFRWALYVPYVILPVLVLFVLAQALRLAIRKPGANGPKDARPASLEDAAIGEEDVARR